MEHLICDSEIYIGWILLSLRDRKTEERIQDHKSSIF